MQKTTQKQPKPVPVLTAQEKTLFGNIEANAQKMTKQDLMIMLKLK